MDKLKITGGRPLEGSVAIAGAKNAALPELAACLLTADAVRLRNVPALRDVRTMMRVLEQLGAAVAPGDAGEVCVTAERIASHEAPYDLVKTMRASVLVLGPLVARYGRARVSLPGGCAIGERPIDLHLAGLEALGAEIRLEHGYVEAAAERLRGGRFAFPKTTVTGTENLMMAAALARGTTVLENCAREPEVEDLGRLLAAMGARIDGAGTSRVTIEGSRELGGAEHAVIPDRIEAGTYVVAGALVGRRIAIERCRPEHLGAVLDLLRRAGVDLQVGDDRVVVGRPERLTGFELRTDPYPGFPTDMQAQFMALATRADGLSTIDETIFEQRFMHVAELRRMGARIHVDGGRAIVEGPTPLTGAQVMATDLRASACLVLAGLAADGITVVDRVYHLDRGYEPMERKLGALGAAVERIR